MEGTRPTTAAGRVTRHRLRHCAYAKWAWMYRCQGEFKRARKYARAAMAHLVLMRFALGGES